MTSYYPNPVSSAKRLNFKQETDLLYHKHGIIGIWIGPLAIF